MWDVNDSVATEVMQVRIGDQRIAVARTMETALVAEGKAIRPSAVYMTRCMFLREIDSQALTDVHPNRTLSGKQSVKSETGADLLYWIYR